MTYFTSDTHFNHTNIIKYCARPFRDVGHMNRELIARWNARVKPEDTVYHLGDFAMGSRTRWPEFREVLNGSIVLVLGNHDGSEAKMRACGFSEVVERVKIPDKKIVLHHQPIPVEPGCSVSMAMYTNLGSVRTI